MKNIKQIFTGLFMLGACPLFAADKLSISSLSSMSGHSLIMLSGDGKNALIKELQATFEKAGLPVDADRDEEIKSYSIAADDTSRLSISLDSGEMATEHPEVYAPQNLMLNLEQKDFAYTTVLSGKGRLSIYQKEIVQSLISAYEKAGQAIEPASGQRGKKFQTPNVRCVDGALSMNPHVSTNCVLTLN